MSRIKELQEQIAVLESELYDLQVAEWWLARPHILQFRCTLTSDNNDDGGYTDYFKPRNIQLNHQWIFQNQDLWYNFCNKNPKYPRPTVPNDKELVENWDYYFRPITNPNDWVSEYPDFQEFDEETMRNPNYA